MTAAVAGCSTASERPSVNAGPSVIVLEGERPFPESVTSTSDGDLYFGTIAHGAIYKADAGAAKAELWVEGGALQAGLILGVLADDKNGVLYLCSSKTPDQPETVTGTSVKSVGLDDGMLRATYPFPDDQGVCNDLALGADGTLYATDTGKGRVVRLPVGGDRFEEWMTDEALGGVNGIAILRDGNVYVNSIASGQIFKIEVGSGGVAGQLVQLTLSEPMRQPDGMRSFGGDRLLLVEQAGRLLEVTIDGTDAAIRTISDQFEEPASLALVGNSVYVLDAKLSFSRTGEDPGSATAYRIDLGVTE